MDLIYILDRYKDFHESTLPAFIERIRNNKTNSVKDSNPPKWILWHMIRGEDFGLNRFVYNREQIFTKKNWNRKMNINITGLGTGMSKEEVRELDDRLKLNLINDYREEMYFEYCNAMRELTTEKLNAVVEETRIKSIVYEEGLFDGTTEQLDYLFHIYSGKKSVGFYCTRH